MQTLRRRLPLMERQGQPFRFLQRCKQGVRCTTVAGVRDNTDPNNTVVWTTGVLKTARALPTVTASANPSTNIPAGASVTLTASATGSGGYSFTWNNSATANPTTVTPTATTNYTVTADGPVHVVRQRPRRWTGDGRSFGGRSDCHDG